MRGDMCPFDHGVDPVVVDDVNIGNVLPFPEGKVVHIFSFEYKHKT